MGVLLTFGSARKRASVVGVEVRKDRQVKGMWRETATRCLAAAPGFQRTNIVYNQTQLAPDFSHFMLDSGGCLKSSEPRGLVCAAWGMGFDVGVRGERGRLCRVHNRGRGSAF